MRIVIRGDGTPYNTKVLVQDDDVSGSEHELDFVRKVNIEIDAENAVAVLTLEVSDFDCDLDIKDAKVDIVSRHEKKE